MGFYKNIKIITKKLQVYNFFRKKGLFFSEPCAILILLSSYYVTVTRYTPQTPLLFGATCRSKEDFFCLEICKGVYSFLS